MKLFSLSLVLFSSTICFADEQLPTAYRDKIESMPDFCQADERFGAFPGHGSELCGPTALSNTFVWLNGHGFPKLLPHHKATLAEQSELIRQLCKNDYLATDEHTGTSPKHIVSGIEHYLKTAGYDSHIEQMGWRNSLHRIGKIPDEKWMLRSCMGASNILLNVGWYKLHQGNYTRMDGHWITLVGFAEQNGHRTLYIHDPGKGSGIEKKTEPCRLIPIPKHHTLALQNAEPISADGFFELKGILIKRGADLAIVDGAIEFKPIDKSR